VEDEEKGGGYMRNERDSIGYVVWYCQSSGDIPHVSLGLIAKGSEDRNME